ncbi:phosphorylase [Synechococcus elongatus]|uniref:ATP adenylyltransferase C-terminal domain-containing protein n=1 Tax=Synechococcus elongatus (strain ATCC 33912 / PCC 7942 / FACHB-805) TaxID=1140 RepID=Q31P24_SYNE7|nr:phosphorylase [Synechococcus elongatus]ABB57195.1 hypothetical protein Synpcc7942_1165 [Synechococcus elongatus PCC 7942 = FACHB-805]UOW70977.1 phosphorylase [Synechococcus elongatus PCC 7943]UOW73698.1 phosphorylase [Synechococcus elongatus PCC 6311]UOW76418.1 phosphorylase [Synechococcus elongatus PCC 6301]
MRITAIAALPHFLSLSAVEAGETLYETYRQLWSQLGVQLDGDRPPAHNLLLTRQWLFIVPLSRESHLPINVNALGFADRTRKARGSNPLSSIFQELNDCELQADRSSAKGCSTAHRLSYQELLLVGMLLGC